MAIASALYAASAVITGKERLVAPTTSGRYRDDMKRGRVIGVRLVVFLLLGAVINIAVAWGCAIWSDAPLMRPAKWTADSSDLERLQRLGWTPRPANQSWEYWHSIHGATGFGLSEWYVVERSKSVLDDLPSHRNYSQRQFHIGTEFQAGWPMRSMFWTSLDRTGNGQGVIAVLRSWRPRAESGITGRAVDGRDQTPREDWDRSMSAQLPPTIGPFSLSSERVLPLRPLWVGFIMNTAMYASVLWLAASTVSGRRRQRRFSRGRCPRCGYDLRGDYTSACSECGWLRKRGDSA